MKVHGFTAKGITRVRSLFNRFRGAPRNYTQVRRPTFRSIDQPITRTGKAYGTIPGGAVTQPGVGEAIRDKVDRSGGGAIYAEPETANPIKVFNIGEQIEDGERVVIWRDQTAFKFEENQRSPSEAWLVEKRAGGESLPFPDPKPCWLLSSTAQSIAFEASDTVIEFPKANTINWADADYKPFLAAGKHTAIGLRHVGWYELYFALQWDSSPTSTTGALSCSTVFLDKWGCFLEHSNTGEAPGVVAFSQTQMHTRWICHQPHGGPITATVPYRSPSLGDDEGQGVLITLKVTRNTQTMHSSIDIVRATLMARYMGHDDGPLTY